MHGTAVRNIGLQQTRFWADFAAPSQDTMFRCAYFQEILIERISGNCPFKLRSQAKINCTKTIFI